MAIAYVTERAQSFSDSDASSYAVALSTASTIAVGNHLVIGLHTTTTVTVTSITDPRGNTWQIDVGVTNAANNSRLTIASCKVANAYSNGDSLTVNMSAGAQSAIWGVQEFSGLDATSWLDKTATNAGATDTTRDSGTTATLSQADEVCVAVLGAGAGASSAGTYDADWTSVVHDQRSTNLIRGMEMAYKIVSATTAEQYGATGAASTPWAGVIATYKAASSVTVPSRALPPILDNFNRANGSVGSNWTANFASLDSIVSNQLEVTQSQVWNQGATIGETMVYLTLAAVGSSGMLALQARAQGNLNAPDMYVGRVTVGSNIQFVRYIAGSGDFVGSDIPLSSALTAGDRLLFECLNEGGDVRLNFYRSTDGGSTWVLEGSVLDNNAQKILTPGRIGVGTYNTPSGWFVDDFGGGNPQPPISIPAMSAVGW